MLLCLYKLFTKISFKRIENKARIRSILRKFRVLGSEEQKQCSSGHQNSFRKDYRVQWTVCASNSRPEGIGPYRIASDNSSHATRKDRFTLYKKNRTHIRIRNGQCEPK